MTMRSAAILLGALLAVGCAGAQEQDPLRVHVISASKEYKSEPSLKEFRTWIEKRCRVTFTASWASDKAKKLDSLDSLKDADLLLVFARRLNLGGKQMGIIRAHWEQGKPVVGIRTAGHAFQEDDNGIFDRKVLGGNYDGHFKDEPVKVINVAKDHPVLEGVGPFVSRKLYKAGELAKSTVVLQEGDIGKAKHVVTIVNEYKGGRTFFTSLGVPEDFANPNFRRMLVNALFWTARRDPEKLKK